MVWYSSSIPMLRLGLGPPMTGILRTSARDTGRDQLSPMIRLFMTPGMQRAIDRHIRDSRYDPGKIIRANGLERRVGRGVHKIDRVRNTILDGELHRVEIVSERAAQRQRVGRHPLSESARRRGIAGHVTEVMRL